MFWNSGSASRSSVLGRGKGTGVIERIRPGRGDSSTTRSARNTASVIECVTSTTFALVHEHQGRVPIVHADLYRLMEVDELFELGLEEQMADAIVFIEWGERFLTALGAPTLVLRFSITGETAREVRIEGPDHGRLAGAVAAL